LAFVKLLKPLAKNFDVYCLDLPGQALSSRPSFEYESAEEIIDFFTDSLENWREKEGLENFHLVGHSFGGYLASFYALKYPERVDNLILLSPAGIKHE
jgi:abhydrolase domain-containing protein 5